MENVKGFQCSMHCHGRSNISQTTRTARYVQSRNNTDQKSESVSSFGFNGVCLIFSKICWRLITHEK